MPKIVIDARIIKTSTGRYIERLLHYLQQIDSDNEYIVLVREKDDWQPTAPNFKAHLAPIANFSFAEQLALNRLVRSLKPDLVHFTMPQYPLLFDFSPIPRVSTIHDLTMLNFKHRHWNAVIDGIKRQVFKTVMRRAATKAARVITPSQFVKKQITERYPMNPDKIIVTYESADRLSETVESFKPMKNKRFLFYMGSVTPYKNIRRLIEAFAILKTSQPDLNLVIAGKIGRFHTPLMEFVKQEKIVDLHFVGFVPDSRAAWLYEHAEAFVHPSLSEGFGLMGLEAMRHNCPLVASNASCFPEVYGKAAHYFDPMDVKDMARAINDVLSDPTLRQNLLQTAAHQREQYSWRRMAEQTLDVYKAILKI